MGHPGYTVDGGQVIFKGQNVLAMEPDERARLGMFLAFQYPVVVPGISMANFLRTALNSKRGYDGKDKSKQVTPKEFRSMLKGELEVLHMDDSFLPRYINDGFSGGERSAPRSCRWRCSSRRSRSSTRPTRVSTSTPSNSSPRRSTACAVPSSGS